MGYTSGSKINPEIIQRETNLLRSGFNYAEVSRITGTKLKTVAERNRIIYKVNLWDAFKRRIEREGIKSRLRVTDEFGNWFAGFFDGEGSFDFYTGYKRRRDTDYRVGIHIALRDDDAETIEFIKKNLGVGIIYRKPARGPTNPSIEFTIRAYKDLAEIIIPLFERYPLRTKKAKQFGFWKTGVIAGYIRTLGSYSRRKTFTEEEKAFFEDLAKRIGEIRTYS